MMPGLLLAVTVVVLGYLVRPRAVGTRQGSAHSVALRSLRRHAPPTPDDWARWLETVAADVRGGTSLSLAVDAAHAQHEFVGSEVTPGRTLRSLAAARPDDPHEAVVTQVLAVATALGGSVAATLQAGAALLRERAAVASEAQAHAAQARLSARVLIAVPLVFAAWNLVAGASYRRALLTPVGALAACLGVALSAAGWWWMRQLVDRAAR